MKYGLFGCKLKFNRNAAKWTINNSIENDNANDAMVQEYHVPLVMRAMHNIQYLL